METGTARNKGIPIDKHDKEHGPDTSQPSTRLDDVREVVPPRVPHTQAYPRPELKQKQIERLQQEVGELTAKLLIADSETRFRHTENTVLANTVNRLDDRIQELETKISTLRRLLHGLANAATVVQGNAEFISEGSAEDPQIIVDFNRSLEQFQRFVRLIMSFTREGQPPRLQKHNLKDLIDDIVSGQARLHKNRNIVIQINSFEDNNFQAEVDSYLLEESIINLINNAVEATQDSGTITVLLSRTQDHICITVKDDGCGISKEHTEAIFNPDFTTKLDGHGLGLAIVDKTIAAHNGYIEVKSEPKKGAEFRIFIPATN